MKSPFRKYIQLYGVPVACAGWTIFSFCFYKPIGIILGGIALIALFTVFRKESLKIHFIDITILGILLIELFSVLWSDSYSRSHIYNLFFNTLVYFAIRTFLQRKKQIDLFIKIIAGFVILLSLLTAGSFLFFKFNIEYEGFSNLVNFKSLFHPLGFLLNDWVAVLLISLAFLLISFTQFNFKSIAYKIDIIGLLFCAFGIVCSFSRGAYLALTVGFFTFLFLAIVLKTVPYKKLVLILAGACTVIILSILPVRKEVAITAGFSSTTSQTRSTSGRLDLWNTSFKLFKERPLRGVGSKNFSLYANSYLAEREDATFTGRATNSYLQLLVEQGIIGFIPWAVFVCSLLWMLFLQIRARNKNSLQALIVFSVFIAVLFREITFSSFFELPQFQLLFFVLTAWVVNHEKNDRFKFTFPQWLLPILLSGLFLSLSGFKLAYNYSKKKNEKFIRTYQNEKYKEALNAINKALKFDRNNPLLHANKANLLVKMASNDSLKKEALQFYQTAVKHSPVDPYLNHNLAWLHQLTGSADSAHHHMRKARNLSRNSALFHIGMFEWAKENGELNGSWQHLEKAIRLSPDLLDSEYIQVLGNKYGGIFRGTLKNIADSLTIKTEKDNSPILKSRLGKIQLHLGDTVSAMKLWEEATHELPNLDRPWYNMAMVKLAQKDTSTFKSYLNRSILLDPRDYLYAFAYGNFYYSLEQKRDAIYYYKNALFNHANLYNHYALIAPKWYGYQALPNNTLPPGRLQSIKPSISENLVCNRLIELYNDLGMKEESLLTGQYLKGRITINKLAKELNKHTFN